MRKDKEVTVNDIGKHFLSLNASSVLDEDIGKMIRRFVKTFGNLHTDDNGKTFIGVFTGKEVKDEDD